MDKMKRIFSFVLVFAILAGSFASFSTLAFADEAVVVEETKVLNKVPADIIGTQHEKAVRRLVAFGIIGGYPDGSYKPERVVNRAQFAKIIVEALGLRDAVPAAEGQATGFKDVAKDYWAAGYINVASGQGLIKGYPDGTFKPAKDVTYAQALTMLVRALGYQDEFLKGNWPGNYVAKAADAGITKGVSIPSNAQEPAKRGYVAELVNNALDSKVVKVDTYKPSAGTIEYHETDVTLLKEKLEISKHEDTRIFADKVLDDGLRKDEASVRFLKDTREPKEVRVSYRENDEKDFRTNFNVRPYLGEEVTTYLTDRDEVIYVERENDDRANFDFIEEADKDEVSLVKFDKDYKFEKEADVFVFNSKDDRFDSYRGKDLDSDKIADLDLEGRYGKFVVRNNRIVFAEIIESTEATPWFLVLKNDKGKLEGINEKSEDFVLDLRKDGTYDNVLVYDIEGNEIDVKDLEEGNVLYVQAQDYDGDDYAVVYAVTDNKVTGELGRFREDRVEINGKFMKAIKFGDNKYSTFYTVDTLEDIEKWAEGDWETDLDDAHKEDVTVYTDAVGKIAFLTTKATANSGYKYGIVTRTYADSDRVRIFTTIDGKEGKDQIFKADKDRNLTNPRLITFDGKEFDVDGKDGQKKNILGAAVKFRLNKDGEIDENEFYMMDRKAAFEMKKDRDFGKDTIQTEDMSFSIKDSVTIIDAEGLNPEKDGFDTEKGDIESIDKDLDIDDFGIVEWKDMKETKYDKEIKFYVFPKKDRDEDAEALVFIGEKGANTGSDKVAVYVIERWRKGDDIVAEYAEYGSNEVKKAVVDNANNIKDVERRAPYILEERSNGKVKLIDKDVDDKDDNFKFIEGKVEKVSSDRVTVDGKSYTLSSSAVVYEKDTKKSTSNIKVDSEVVLIVEDEIRVRVVKIGEKTTEKEDEVKKDEYFVKGAYELKGEFRIMLAKTKDGKATTYEASEEAFKAAKLAEDKKVEVKFDGKLAISVEEVKETEKPEEGKKDDKKEDVKDDDKKEDDKEESKEESKKENDKTETNTPAETDTPVEPTETDTPVEPTEPVVEGETK